MLDIVVLWIFGNKYVWVSQILMKQEINISVVYRSREGFEPEDY